MIRKYQNLGKYLLSAIGLYRTLIVDRYYELRNSDGQCFLVYMCYHIRISLIQTYSDQIRDFITRICVVARGSIYIALM